MKNSFTVLLMALPLFCFAQCWQKMAGGNLHVAALKSDGTIWAWGQNMFGEIGDGTNEQRNSPVQAGSDSDWVDVQCGLRYTMALKSDGSLWGWGHNELGQLGIGDTLPRSVPVKIGESEDWQAFSAGYSHVIAMKTDGSLWAWGFNMAGQLGDGTNVSKTTPVLVDVSGNWKMISAGGTHNLALKNDGTLWGWGNNYYGNLGNGGFDNSWQISQIGTASDWNLVYAGGQHNIALKIDGSLYTWGLNNYGQLGIGTSVLSVPNPTPLAFQVKGTNIAADYNLTLAIAENGTLWTWGNNIFGQMGANVTANQFSPLQIGSESDWDSVVIAGGTSFAIKSSGETYVWGSNFVGQFGDGTAVSSNVPNQVACSNLGTLEDTTTDISVYPNPAGDMLFITAWDKIAKFEMFDVLGRKVLESEALLENGIDISSLSGGSYVLLMQTSGKLSSCKILKK